MAGSPREKMQEAAALVGRLPGRRVLVVGDVIVDRYVWGDVERTSPEAPVPIVRLRSESTTLGGAANVVANIAALGGVASVVGLIGADAEGVELRARLVQIGAVDALVVDPKRPTTLKTRVMSLGQQLLRLDREQSDPVRPAAARGLIARFKKMLSAAELVILSDYGKGVLGEEVCREMIALARERRKPVIVDPKGMDYLKYRGATVVKPNKKEAEAAAGVRIDSLEALEEAARKLRAVLRGTAIVITRGGEGVSVFERRRRPVHLSSEARAVYDVTGAGDSFMAAMGLALAAGASLADAARLGNAAGSVVVGKLGAASATPTELSEALQGGGTSLGQTAPDRELFGDQGLIKRRQRL